MKITVSTQWKMKNLLFSDLWGNLRIYAQGNKHTIAKIEKALLKSGLFKKIPSPK
jgi:hypothetical protein